ncbi:C1 family peptidase [Sulfobacillus sp. DSM 109850]|uniref:Aminopeptidase n=1 Tax=Sulfobacillus harzensis TaxID=2729629 RepID=A0A7Y0L4T7_9FIRM|nr:C1 family peptidase [Sulfobacillus harzensis]
MASSDLIHWRADFQEEPLRQVIANAIIKNGVQAVAQKRQRVAEMTYTFSHQIQTGAITNQKQSGRCWLFAGLNVMRKPMADRLHVKDFELSQAYMMFYDKLEKANYFLESIMATMDEPVDGRLVSWLLQAPLQDGGQWDMFVNLVEKYGVVPKWVMPESFHSSNSRAMNQLMTAKLREDAARLRALARTPDQMREAKNTMMGEIYGMLAHFLGEPPERFVFTYEDDDHQFHDEGLLTPHEFLARFNSVDLNQYVSVINAPTPDKPFNQTYTVDYLGNVVGGRSVLYLNLPVEEFKALAQRQLEDGEPVWFGCDVGKMSDRESGILDVDQYAYDAALGVTLGLTKAERLMYGESLMTHAMVLTGVNVADGQPNRWKVENSWGPDAGNRGFFVMSDAWFNEYMYQVVVQRKYLSQAQLQALETPARHLPPWDPMGSLA